MHPWREPFNEGVAPCATLLTLSEGCGIVAPTEPPPNHFLHEIIDNQIFKCFYNLTFQPVFAADPILGFDIRYHSMLSATTPSMMRLSSERLDFYIVLYPPLVNSIEAPPPQQPVDNQ